MRGMWKRFLPVSNSGGAQNSSHAGRSELGFGYRQRIAPWMARAASSFNYNCYILIGVSDHNLSDRAMPNSLRRPAVVKMNPPTLQTRRQCVTTQ